MFRKVSFVLGALALLAVASQGFVASDAAAKGEKAKAYVCHFSNGGSKSKVVQVNVNGGSGSLDEHLNNTSGLHGDRGDYQVADRDGNRLPPDIRDCPA